MMFSYILCISLLIAKVFSACTDPDNLCTADCVTIGFVQGTLKEKGPCTAPTSCLKTAGACDSTKNTYLQACTMVGYQNNQGNCLLPSYALCSSPGNSMCQTSTLSLCTSLYGLQQAASKSCGSTTDSLCLSSSQGCGSPLYPCMTQNGLSQNVTISQACAPPSSCTATGLQLCGGTYTYCLSKGYSANSTINLDCKCKGIDDMIECLPSTTASGFLTILTILYSILIF